MIFMAKPINRLRRCSGTHIIELGPTLWIVFLIVFFPMLTFGSMGLAYMPMVNATRLAAQAAAQCKSFQTNVDSADLSAVNTANQIVNQSTTCWSQVSVQKITTSIVICNYSSKAVTRQQTPLSQPANTTTNAYNCEVLAQGTIQPLFRLPQAIFGSVPGLSAPIQTSTRSLVVFENTQGLTQ